MSEEIKKAGLLLRSIAKTIDLIVVAAAAEIIPNTGFFAGLVYILISDGLFEGRSIGKYLTGLRTISVSSNKPCTIKESILRNFIPGIGVMLFKLPFAGWILMPVILLLEFIVLLGSKEGMRIGDEIAGTTVIEQTTI